MVASRDETPLSVGVAAWVAPLGSQGSCTQPRSDPTIATPLLFGITLSITRDSDLIVTFDLLPTALS